MIQVKQSPTTGRSLLGRHTLDEILKAQDTIATDMPHEIDDVTGPWGMKVELVQMKSVEIPPSMRRAMAQAAEALREKRAADQSRGRAGCGRAAGRRSHHAKSGRA
jgi:regulator of protease activity HflC (stomatin/prohibitin superfamily)